MGQAPERGDWAAFEREAAIAFETGIERGHCIAWLAEAGAAPVGSSALLLYPHLPSPTSAAPREGYLLSVYTVPAWRRRGVAAALVRAAIESGRHMGLARVRLHATSAGRAIYAAAGFGSRDDEMELKLP